MAIVLPTGPGPGSTGSRIRARTAISSWGAAGVRAETTRPPGSSTNPVDCRYTGSSLAKAEQDHAEVAGQGTGQAEREGAGKGDSQRGEGVARAQGCLAGHVPLAAARSAVLPLARLVEGTYLIGTASAAKHDYLRAQGVHQAIDYRTQDWTAAVRATHPGGIDIVLDSLGEDCFAPSIGLLRYGGRVIGYGLSGTMQDDSSAPDLEAALSGPAPLSAFLDNATGFIGCHLGAPAPLFRQWLSHLIDLCEQGAIRPHIDRVFPLEAAADAHRYLHQRRNTGKVLLQP